MTSATLRWLETGPTHQAKWTRAGFADHGHAIEIEQRYREASGARSGTATTCILTVPTHKHTRRGQFFVLHIPAQFFGFPQALVAQLDLADLAQLLAMAQYESVVLPR